VPAVTDEGAMTVILLIALVLASLAATAHMMSTSGTPLPARVYYQFVASLRWLGTHPLERFMRAEDRTSRRENFLVCLWAYFLTFVAIGVFFIPTLKMHWKSLLAMVQ